MVRSNQIRVKSKQHKTIQPKRSLEQTPHSHDEAKYRDSKLVILLFCVGTFHTVSKIGIGVHFAGAV